MEKAMETQNTKQLKSLNCDKVVWLYDALNRYAEIIKMRVPSISRGKDVAKIACLLEIMEILGYKFEDTTSRHNAIAHIAELNDLGEEAYYES